MITTLVALGCAVALVAWLRRRYLVVVVQGDSMLPTLRHGQRLVVRRAHGNQACAGDIVVFPAPAHPALLSADAEHSLLVKRLISSDGPWFDRVVVLGDNRAASQDSRLFGPIKRSSIIGIASRA